MLRSAARAAGLVPKGISKAPPTEYWNALMDFARSPENKKIVATAQAAAMQAQRHKEEIEAAFPIVSHAKGDNEPKAAAGSVSTRSSELPRGPCSSDTRAKRLGGGERATAGGERPNPNLRAHVEGQGPVPITACASLSSRRVSCRARCEASCCLERVPKS